MPCLDVGEIHGCNCFKSKPASVVISSEEAVAGLELATNSLTILEKSVEDDHDTVNMVDRVTFIIKGSTYYEECQVNLKKLKKYLAEEKEIELIFTFEEDNDTDKNAIKILAEVDNSSLSLGYVPGERILQLRKAMKENIIISAKLVKVLRKYAPTGKLIYIGEMSVVSTKKLSVIDRHYQYNDPIHC